MLRFLKKVGQLIGDFIDWFRYGLEREFLWEYSPVARAGDLIWKKTIDPALRLFAHDHLAFLRRARGTIQVTVLVAILLVPASILYGSSHLLNAAGLLFDIAGVLRLFLLEEIEESLQGLKSGCDDEHDLPSVAVGELLMPEAGPFAEEASHISQFYYKKRGILFLALGFFLQFLSDFL